MKWITALVLCWCSLAFGQAVSGDVTQENIGETICKSGWTKTVRPSVHYTNWVKGQMAAHYGIPEEKLREYELDHIVPLELGGHPYAPENLQLQLWVGAEGARSKDAVETWLKKMVCAKKITLVNAQICVATEWEHCKALYAVGELK